MDLMKPIKPQGKSKRRRIRKEEIKKLAKEHIYMYNSWTYMTREGAGGTGAGWRWIRRREMRTSVMVPIIKIKLKSKINEC